MTYLPFLSGVYSVAPALQNLKKGQYPEDKLIFQIDEHYNSYVENKENCRAETIHKYYREEGLDHATAVGINKKIISQLLNEHCDKFELVQDKEIYKLSNKLTGKNLFWQDDWLTLINGSNYISLFDALACQVQEDLAICKLEGDRDSLVALHICSPNYWAPAEKAGKRFDEVHSIVPGMEKTFVHYFKMLLSAVNKGPFTRFAWGIATDTRLNHHPVPAPGADVEIWKGRKISDACELFLRVERQNLLGLPEVNAFLFSIRTYFYPVSGLAKDEKVALLQAIESMSEESLEYKGLSGQKEKLRQLINT